jgi:hypothetical protein
MATVLNHANNPPALGVAFAPHSHLNAAWCRVIKMTREPIEARKHAG